VKRARLVYRLADLLWALADRLEAAAVALLQADQQRRWQHAIRTYAPRSTRTSGPDLTMIDEARRDAVQHGVYG
jgi:hypothetical protein